MKMSKRDFLIISDVAEYIQQKNFVSPKAKPLVIRFYDVGSAIYGLLIAPPRHRSPYAEIENVIYVLQDEGAIEILEEKYSVGQYHTLEGFSIKVIGTRFKEVREVFRQASRSVGDKQSGLILSLDEIPDQVEISFQLGNIVAKMSETALSKGGRPKESLPQYKKDHELKRLKFVCKIKGKYESILLEKLFDFQPHESNSLEKTVDTKDLTSLFSALRKKIKNEKYSIKTHREIQQTTYQLKHPTFLQTNY